MSERLRERHEAQRRIIDAVNAGDFASSFLRGGRIEPDKLSMESRAILRAAADLLTAGPRTPADTPAPVAEQPSPWQPIETAPMDGTQVILWRDGEVFSARWVKESAIGPVWATPDGYVVFGATLWMPLPPPPEQE